MTIVSFLLKGKCEFLLGGGSSEYPQFGLDSKEYRNLNSKHLILDFNQTHLF